MVDAVNWCAGAVAWWGEVMRYFFDTEFIERGSEHPIRLLSIGIVSEDGRELYCEIVNADSLIEQDFRRFADPWLKINVQPHLRSVGMRLDEIRSHILAFVGDDKPEFWAYLADYDWVVLCQIFGRMIDLPKGWPMHCLDLKQEMKTRGVNREQLPEQGDAEHSALNDARWTRDAFIFVTNVEVPVSTKEPTT